MNIYLSLSVLVLIAYVVGRIFDRLGFPKIIGYILIGIAFSPNTFGWVEKALVGQTEPLLNIALSFIAFEVGGELRWKTIKGRSKELISITLSAAFIPFVLVAGILYLIWTLFPGFFPFESAGIALAVAILFAALASPTDPTATLAVIHEYHAKGKVKDTILGVAALDDALGVLLFSVAVSLGLFIVGKSGQFGASLLEAGGHIGGGILTGLLAAGLLNFSLPFLKDENEGQWIVVIFSTVALCYGVSAYFDFDELLACMIMGLTVANVSRHHKIVFNTIERYTEELIFLFFFVLSGLELKISTIPAAALPVLVFVLLRGGGKLAGTYLGAYLAGSENKIRKYTAGGLLPQGGIVIGLALTVQHYEVFSQQYEFFLAMVMGAVIINELLGPLLAKYSLEKAGEINERSKNHSEGISRVARSKQEARASYNRLSKIYDSLIHPWERKPKETGLDMLEAQEGEHILEIGFGTGVNLIKIAKSVGKRGQVKGIDIADRMVEITREKLEKGGVKKWTALKRGDATQLPYEDNSFDAVFMSFVLDLFDNPDIPKVLEECKRVLNPRGRLVNISLQKADTPANDIYETAHKAFPKTVDCRPIPADTLLEEAGFTVEKKKDLSMFGLKVSCILGRPDRTRRR